MSKFLTNVGYLESPDVAQDGSLIGVSGPAIVFVQAGWCGYCQKSKPIYQAYADLQKGLQKVKCLTVQDDISGNGTEDMKGVSKRFKTDGFPSWFLYRDGKLVGKESGYKPSLDELTKMIEGILG